MGSNGRIPGLSRKPTNANTPRGNTPEKPIDPVSYGRKNVFNSCVALEVTLRLMKKNPVCWRPRITRFPIVVHFHSMIGCREVRGYKITCKPYSCTGPSPPDGLRPDNTTSSWTLDTTLVVLNINASSYRLERLTSYCSFRPLNVWERRKLRKRSRVFGIKKS